MRRQRRGASPRLEALEPLTMLSGVAASALALTHAEIATTTTPSPLEGMLRGTFFVHDLDYGFKAAGKLTPIGAATITGSLQENPGLEDEDPTGSMDLSTSKGTLTLQMSDSFVSRGESPPYATAPNKMVVLYNVSDETGAYQNETGIGVVKFAFTSSRTVDGVQAGEVDVKFMTMPKTTTTT